MKTYSLPIGFLGNEELVCSVKMYIKRQEVNLQQIDKSLEKVIERFPSQFLTYLKRNFEKNIGYFLGHPSRVEVDVVVDSSSIIADMLSLVKKGKSRLHQLMKEPFVRFFAPTILKTEVESKMDKLSARKKEDKQVLMRTWQKDFLPNINLKDPEDLMAWIKGLMTVGRRDRKDVPFVALHFEIESQGIITRDKDIIEQPQIRTWKLGRLGKVVTVFKKGTFSFFVFSKLLPTMFYMLFQIGVAVLRVLVEMMVDFLALLSSIAKGTVQAISKLPDWAKVLLGLATLAFVLYDKTRNAALEFLKSISEEVCRFASRLYQHIKSVLDSLAPIVNIAIVVLAYLFQALEQTISQIRDMKLNVGLGLSHA